MGSVLTCVGKFNPMGFFKKDSRHTQYVADHYAPLNVDIGNLPPLTKKEVAYFLKHLDLASRPPVIELVGCPLRDEEDLAVALRQHQAPELVVKVTVTRCPHVRGLPTYIAAFCNLTTLNLRDNALESLPWSIVMLKNLIVLDLSYNLLSELPKTVGYLNKLEVLLLNANFLVQLPTELINLEHLKEVDVSLNPRLVSPSISVCKHGVKQIKQDLFRRRHRTNMWENDTPWIQGSDGGYRHPPRHVKSLLEVCVDAILDYQVDFIRMASVPPVVKSHLHEQATERENRIQVCKCGVCHKFFTSKVTFNEHSCST